MTGVARERLVGTDFSDYFTEPDRARESYRQVFAQGSVTDYPLTIRHTGGDLTDVLYNASLYRTSTATRSASSPPPATSPPRSGPSVK